MTRSSYRPTVLLIEDSDDDAYFFFRAVKKCPLLCEVRHVKDGGAAIRLLETMVSESAAGKAALPELIFLDLKLPTKSGFEVLQWVQDQRLESPLDIAILSGSDDQNDRLRTDALGATGYYVKPLSPEQLQLRLEAWLQRNSSAPLPARPPTQTAVENAGEQRP